MEEMGLHFWFVWTAILVLLGMDSWAMGHFCIEFPLYFCLDARYSLSLDEKQIHIRQIITSKPGRSGKSNNRTRSQYIPFQYIPFTYPEQTRYNEEISFT